MKIELVIAGIMLCAGLAAVSGCKKEQPAAEPQTPKAPETTSSEAKKAVDAAKTAVKDAADQATAQAKAAQDQAQGLIDRAKSYLGENKYQDALNSLNQLANTKLTAEQQKLVDDLKAKIQAALTKAATSNAASALGNALGGKK